MLGEKNYTETNIHPKIQKSKHKNEITSVAGHALEISNFLISLGVKITTYLHKNHQAVCITFSASCWPQPLTWDLAAIYPVQTRQDDSGWAAKSNKSGIRFFAFKFGY